MLNVRIININLKFKSIFSKISSRIPIRVTFVVIGNLIIFFKYGFNMGGSGGVTLPALLEFPRVENIVSISILPLTLYKLIGINSMAQIIMFNFIITILFTSYIFWKIGAQPTTHRLLLLAGVIASPVTMELANLIGIFDLFTIIGWYLYLTSKSSLTLYSGILLVCFSDPPQVPFSCLLLFLFSIANPKLIDRKKLSRLTLISIPSYVLLEIWLALNDASGFLNQNGGGDLFGVSTKDFLINSTFEFIKNMPNSLFSIYGLFWVPILLFIFRLKNLNMILSFLSLILIPVFLAVIFIDSTRVATNIAFPIAAIATIEFFKSYPINQISKQSKIWFTLALFYPVNYYYAGLFVTPFSGYLTMFNIIISENGNCATNVFTPDQQEICSILLRYFS
jgi:hypothetical protein